MKTRWVVLGCLLLARPSFAQLAVTDALSNVQRMVEFIIQQGNEVKKYAEMVQNTRQMVDQVKGTYKALEYMAENLKNMPLDSSLLDWVLSTNDQLTGFLGQVQWIGFSLDQAAAQFESLYRNTAALATPEGRAARIAEMRNARLQMAGAAMQLQAIKQTYEGFLARLSRLLGFSAGADGQKALQQIQVQQAALAQQQAQFGITLAAVANRLVTMEQAEQIVLQQMHDIAAQQLANDWYGDQRFLLPANFTGFRILEAR
jgi:DNA repair exonuclease SbcCD ATPase subunit